MPERLDDGFAVLDRLDDELERDGAALGRWPCELDRGVTERLPPDAVEPPLWNLGDWLGALRGALRMVGEEVVAVLLGTERRLATARLAAVSCCDPELPARAERGLVGVLPADQSRSHV